jgi:hypothetical protein
MTYYLQMLFTDQSRGWTRWDSVSFHGTKEAAIAARDEMRASRPNVRWRVIAYA